jgi:hypothetical protein
MALVSALVGGLGLGVLAWGTFGMMIKSLPGIGSLIGSVRMPVFFGAAICAVGMVFIRHFESGGTFLDLDPSKAKNDMQSSSGEKKGCSDRSLRMGRSPSRRVATVLIEPALFTTPVTSGFPDIPHRRS